MYVVHIKGSAPLHSEVGRYPSKHPLVTFHILTERLADRSHDFSELITETPLIGLLLSGARYQMKYPPKSHAQEGISIIFIEYS